MNAPTDLLQVAARFYDAVNQLQRGDPAPMLAVWSHSAQATNLGPQGGRQQGWADIAAYFARAAELAVATLGAVTASASDLVGVSGGELAYTCCTEHVQVTRQGEITRFSARATHVYRREAGAWKLLHRHADAPPAAADA